MTRIHDWVRVVATWLLPGPDREFILGDLDELHARWTRDHGRTVAARRYIGALLASVRAERSGSAGRGDRRHGGHSLEDGPSAGGGDPNRRSSTGRESALASLTQDVHFGLRSLRRDPVFTAAAVICLALGIGANTAIFSVVHGVLLRALPYASAEELVILNEYELSRATPSRNDPNVGVSYLNALDWRAQAGTLEDLALAASSRYLLLDADMPQHVRGAPVTPNYFDLLGAHAALGRTIVPGETDAVVVLSDRLWRRNFGAAPGVIGRSIRLEGEPFEIIGVMPPEFALPFTSEELWVPIESAPRDYFVVNGTQQRAQRGMRAIARLADGATAADAEAELDVIAERLRRAYPEANEGRGLQVIPLQENRVGRVRETLLMLFAAVGLLLLIACTNVAHLLLARVTARQPEVTIRTALGAGRWRIARQLLTESTLLSIAGGAVGALIAVWAVQLIKATSPGDIPRLAETGVDASALLFTFATSLAVGGAFGVTPALRASRYRARAALQLGPSKRGPGGVGRLGGALVVVEVAIALVLLMGAGLLINSFRYLWSYEPGFDARGVLTVDIPLERDNYPQAAQRAAFFQSLYERLDGVPSVQSVGGVGRLPGDTAGIVVPVVRPSAAEPAEVLLPFRPVSGDFFATLRIPLRAGRVFRDDETDVVLLNESLAAEFWPEGDAVGQLLTVPNHPAPLQVVGVVGDQRFRGTDPVPRPELFVPYGSAFSGLYSGQVVVIRTDGDPSALAATVREHVVALDSEQPIASIRTMDDALTETMARPRFYMALFSLFGALALALSAMGIFGVASYSVTQRTYEVGVRMALGAGRRDVLGLVVGRGAVLTLLGVGIGIVAARALTRYLESLLYGVAPNDPATFVTVPIVLLAAALLAFWLPARRAARVDPIIALRGD